MRAFRYRAVTGEDRAEAGLIEAHDVKDAARRLLERGLYPLDVSARAGSLAQILATPIGINSLSALESTQILADLGHLICAGVEVAPALAVITSMKARPRVRNVLIRLVEKVRVGRALSEAMGDLGGAFPTHVMALVRAGEVSGTLGSALTRAAESQRRATKLRNQLRTAMIYPSCVAAAVGVAILVLVGVVVPTLETLFSGAVQRLPWQTYVLIVVGHGIRGHALALVVAAIAAGAGAIFGARNVHIRRRLEGLALRTPIVGTLLCAAETARVSLVLAMLSSSGLPLVNAVALASSGARLVVSRDALSAAAAKLREGARLHAALSEVPTLSDRVLALIQIGETTARLGPLLEEASRDAEYRVSTAIERALALLTPAMTLVFGAVAGFVLYAVMTSILSVNDLATRGV
jgi:general secretion pathway protein F